MGWKEEQMSRAEEYLRRLEAQSGNASTAVERVEPTGKQAETVETAKPEDSLEGLRPAEEIDWGEDVSGGEKEKPVPAPTPERKRKTTRGDLVRKPEQSEETPVWVPESVDEEAREEMDSWANPSQGGYLEGYVASDIRRLEEYEIRPGLRRWFYSLRHHVPYPRKRVGARFLLRSDDIKKWERNVLIFGDIYSGTIHRGSNIRVRGKLDARSGDVIAQEIISTDSFSGGRMTVGGTISPNVVLLLTLLAGAGIALLARLIVALVLHVPVLVGAFDRYLAANWGRLLVLGVLLFYGLRWIRRFWRRHFHFRRRRRRRY